MSTFTKEQLLELAEIYIAASGYANSPLAAEYRKRAAALDPPKPQTPFIDSEGRYLSEPWEGQEYWMLNAGGEIYQFRWTNSERSDRLWLARGLCFATREAAEAADKKRIAEQEERVRRARG